MKTIQPTGKLFTMSESKQVPAEPWYKQFYPWFLIFFPATAVVAGIITIMLAINSDDGLVKDDYYKAGKAINQTLAKTKLAEQLALSGKTSLDPDTNSVQLILSGKIEQLPAQLSMKFIHTTRANHDQSILLYLSPDNKIYIGKINALRQGNWIIHVEPLNSEWRIQSRVSLPKQSQWITKP